MAPIDVREIVWSPSAVRDVREIHRVFKSRDVPAASALVAAIRTGVEQLRSFPESGPVAQDIPPVGRYRHLLVRRYRIIYRIEGHTIRILRCWDPRRNPAELRVVDVRIVSAPSPEE